MKKRKKRERDSESVSNLSIEGEASWKYNIRFLKGTKKSPFPTASRPQANSWIWMHYTEKTFQEEEEENDENGPI